MDRQLREFVAPPEDWFWFPALTSVGSHLPVTPILRSWDPLLASLGTYKQTQALTSIHIKNIFLATLLVVSDHWVIQMAILLSTIKVMISRSKIRDQTYTKYYYIIATFGVSTIGSLEAEKEQA